MMHARLKILAMAMLPLLFSPTICTAQGSFTITGKVRDLDGAPVSGVEIRCYTEEDLGLLQPSSTCLSSADGSFECSVTAGEYFMGAFPPASSWYAISFYPGTLPNTEQFAAVVVEEPVVDLDFRLQKGGKARVQILDENGEIPEFSVATALFEDLGNGAWWGKVDPDSGIFESEVLPPGTYFLHFTVFDPTYLAQQLYCGVVDWSLAQRFQLTEAQTTELATCRLIREPPRIRISGTVRDGQGALLSGISVRAMIDPLTAVDETVSDAIGEYVLELPETGAKVQAAPPSTRFLQSRYFPDAGTWDQGLWLDQESEGIDFVLQTGGRVRFVLTGESGSAPGFSCAISVHDFNDPTTPVVAESFASPAGEYLSPALPSGRYVFHLRPPADSKYLAGQGFCDRYDWQGGDRVEVQTEQLLDLGACSLIPDRFEPSTRAGSLFSFDEDWVTNRADYPPWNTGAAAFGDLNQDGLMDLVTQSVDSVTSSRGDPTFPAARVNVLLNQDGHHFIDAREQWLVFDYVGGPRDIEIADMDCDGFPDLVLGCFGVEWSDGTPWGEQDKLWRNVEGKYFEDVTAQRVFQDDPAALGFSPEEATNWTTHSLAVGDLDGDGDLDVVRGTPQPVLLNDGNGVLELGPASEGSNGVMTQNWLGFVDGLELGDLNGDGVLDLFLAVAGQAKHELALGRGDGSFALVPSEAAPEQLGSDLVPYQPVLSDFNGDHFQDVYIANMTTLGGMNLWHGDADAPLDQLLLCDGLDNAAPLYVDASPGLEQDPQMNTSWHATAGDFDNDGDMDIVVSNNSFGNDGYRSPEIRILDNRGNQEFAAVSPSLFPSFVATSSQTLLFDSDNDGDLDIFLGNGFTVPILLVNRLLEKHDLDEDGYVTLDDAAEVLAAVGGRGADMREDLDGDGVVNARDLSLILRYQTTSRADNSTLVPRCTRARGGKE